jgi:uncharacterized membrane protein YvbJ
MDDCPHCGEPVEDDAEACPHCGSDFENGWKPDADDYSVELPEDDAVPREDESDPNRLPAWEAALHVTLVLFAYVLFIGTAANFHKAHLPQIAAFSLLPAVSLLWYYRMLARRRA